jgi:hypothetical protein
MGNRRVTTFRGAGSRQFVVHDVVRAEIKTLGYTGMTFTPVAVSDT